MLFHAMSPAEITPLNLETGTPLNLLTLAMLAGQAYCLTNVLDNIF